ncbi:MAG: energy-coupling factor ABC transporter ATP-binding protein, partial [Dehalococcoidia bacterium]
MLDSNVLLQSETGDAAAAPAPVLVRDLDYAYPDGTPALRGIDLHVQTGERVALVGPNGAGKSTLLLHLNGTIRGHGDVFVEGIRVDDPTLPRVRALVGLVFQNPDDQLFSPTVFDDVAYGPLYMGLPIEEIRARVTNALAAVDMSGFEDRMPHHLSIGQKKRIALATVLSMNPSILALDEPSAGLDPRARRTLVDLLRCLPQTLIASTHDMRLVRDVFDRVIILDEGRIVADVP